MSLCDRFGREIRYLRVSVTDRCDQRCIYCMAADGIPLKRHDEILSYEQIEAVVRAAVKLGITKVRLTGGEPLVRRNIEQLVERLAAIDGLHELCMTTNGTRLAQLAAVLKQNGLDRVNISLDSVDPARYRYLTRGGRVEAALAGIDAAAAAGFVPIKINMVILEDTTDSELESMRAFCANKGLQLQRIMQFSLYDRGLALSRRRTERPPSCADCNRLRLTPDGFLKPCLFSEKEIRVDFADVEHSIRTAVDAKPQAGSMCRNRSMSAIGG